MSSVESFVPSVLTITERAVEKVRDLKTEENKWENAAKSIMTTDTFPKAISVKTMIENKTITITGIAKGSGMIEPNMATMLGFIFIDCLIPQNILQKLLKVMLKQEENLFYLLVKIILIFTVNLQRTVFSAKLVFSTTQNTI